MAETHPGPSNSGGITTLMSLQTSFAAPSRVLPCVLMLMSAYENCRAVKRQPGYSRAFRTSLDQRPWRITSPTTLLSMICWSCGLSRSVCCAEPRAWVLEPRRVRGVYLGQSLYMHPFHWAATAHSRAEAARSDFSCAGVQQHCSNRAVQQQRGGAVLQQQSSRGAGQRQSGAAAAEQSSSCAAEAV